MNTYYKCKDKEEMRTLSDLAKRLGYLIGGVRNFNKCSILCANERRVLRLPEYFARKENDTEVSSLPEFQKALVEGKLKKGDRFTCTRSPEWIRHYEKCEIELHSGFHTCYVICDRGWPVWVENLRIPPPTDEEMKEKIKEWAKDCQWKPTEHGIEGTMTFDVDLKVKEGPFTRAARILQEYKEHKEWEPLPPSQEHIDNVKKMGMLMYRTEESLIPPPPKRTVRAPVSRKYLTLSDFKIQ